VRDVDVTLAPVDAGLSTVTGGAAALGLAEEAPV
jgi:hypothetical protein